VPAARKIAGNPVLREFVKEHLEQRWSPRQISNRLRAEFPGQTEMHVVPETVYQALYGRGSLDLAVDPAIALRSGGPVVGLAAGRSTGRSVVLTWS
jgi:transposase, IS30 family